MYVYTYVCMYNYVHTFICTHALLSMHTWVSVTVIQCHKGGVESTACSNICVVDLHEKKQPHCNGIPNGIISSY